METMSKVKIAVLIGGAVGGLYFFLSRRKKTAQRPMMNPVTKQANTPAPPPVEPPQQSLMDMIPPADTNPVSHR